MFHTHRLQSQKYGTFLAITVDDTTCTNLNQQQTSISTIGLLNGSECTAMVTRFASVVTLVKDACNSCTVHIFKQSSPKASFIIKNTSVLHNLVHNWISICLYCNIFNSLFNDIWDAKTSNWSTLERTHSTSTDGIKDYCDVTMGL